MLNGACRSPNAVASSGTRATAPPPATSRIGLNGDTGSWRVPTSVSTASSGSSARKSADQ